MSTVRRIRDQLERMEVRPDVHFVSKADRAAAATELGKMDRNLPPHLAATIKDLTISGVEIRSFDLIHPDNTLWEASMTRNNRRTSK